MDDILTTLSVFWLSALAFYVLVHRGLWIFTDVTRTMSMFTLEKALGPGIDLVEGRKGSAPRAWIMQSVLWLFVGAIFTFEGLWLNHEPDALHALSSWGYNPTAETLSATGEIVTLWGGIAMALIGSGMYALPKLLGTDLASEKNATLVSFLWTISIVVYMIGSQNSEILGIDIMMIGTGINVIALLAVIMNQLLTLSNRSGSIPMPAWLIIFGLISDPLSLVAAALTGSLTTGAGQWLVYHMIGGGFFFLSTAGVALYATTVVSGNALWSRTLNGAILIGGLFTINTFGDIDGSLAAAHLGLAAEEMAFSGGADITASFLLAMSAIPVVAFAANSLVTLRGGDALLENYNGWSEINLGSLAIIPIFLASLFLQTDAVTGTNAIGGMSQTIETMALWAVMVPLSFGSAMALYPSITGRRLASMARARQAFWLMSVGVLLGLMVTLMSDVIGMALMDAGVEDPSSLAHDLEVAGSVFFYFTVVAMILHCLNMISGLFRGNIVEEESKMSSSIVVDTYDLASATTVRRILSSGAGMDTMVVPVGESDESGSATDL
ncbi:MAG: hypothetical protein P8Q35_06435 [Candidatus Thalassarchaeaceae archaeon]|nr:hypothetical protein [Candidatus Thalassarchaeaceae archaeon]